MSHNMIVCNSRDEWLKNRQNTIGGSDAACVLGINPYKTNRQLWAEKTGRAVLDDISDKDAVKYGKEAEKYLIALFALDHPEYDVKPGGFDLLFHSMANFLTGTLDANLTETETGRKGFLETKTTEIRNAGEWDNWNNKIPPHYLCQVLHYFSLDDEFQFAILKVQIKYTTKNKEKRTECREYYYDREVMQPQIDYLTKKEIEFYNKYIETGIEPPLIVRL